VASKFRAPAKLTSAAEIEKLERKIETCGITPTTVKFLPLEEASSR
jgi:hypothetical protein